MVNTTLPHKIVCAECFTEELNFDALASWNSSTQQMETHNVFPQAYCTVCGKEATTLDIPLERRIHLSMSDLLKKTAKQLCYLRLNAEKERPPSVQMIEGNESAAEKSISKYIEMRGTYIPNIEKTKQLGQFLMHYAFDEVDVNDASATFTEHKNIKDADTVETWYLHSSLLQTAVYQALVKVNKDRMLQTATFHVNLGNPKLHLDLNNLYENSQLHIGNDKYTIIVLNAEKLVEFYIEKAIASFDYRTAEAFDSAYKHREFQELKSCFTFRPIQD